MAVIRQTSGEYEINRKAETEIEENVHKKMPTKSDALSTLYL